MPCPYDNPGIIDWVGVDIIVPFSIREAGYSVGARYHRALFNREDRISSYPFPFARHVILWAHDVNRAWQCHAPTIIQG
jgi:hypothetical protein